MRTLIIVAHLDDEIFGMGGTILQMKKAGDNIQVVSLCSGRDRDNVLARTEATNKITEELGIIYSVYPYLDRNLPEVPLYKISNTIECEISAFRPDRVFTVSEQDIHQDHQVVSKAVKIACRPNRNYSVKELYEMKIPGCEPFTETYYDTVSYIDERDRQRLCEIYESETPPEATSKEYFRTIHRVL